jgi:tRNA acetyltransferase TAN1
VIFFKTHSPIEPVSFVHKICQDTADGVEHQRCRFVKRLTPLSAIAKVSGNGLKDVATQVLAPHFHGPGQSGKKVS